MRRAILEPEELPEVEAPGRALVRLGGGDLAPLALGLFRERAVHVADLHPVRPPVLPFRRPALDLFEIVHVDAVGGRPQGRPGAHFKAAIGGSHHQRYA